MSKRKGSRELKESAEYRSDFSRKRPKPPNKWTGLETATTDSNARKIRSMDNIHLLEDPDLDYRIFDFAGVFKEISQLVNCKTCGGGVKFQTEATRGLGFKIVVVCDYCSPTAVSSCPKIGSSYEINSRFTFAMRCLGHGEAGAQKFCGLMDLPAPLTRLSHNEAQKNIHTASKAIAEALMKEAVQEEQLRMSIEQEVDNCTDLCVSGDGTWQKRGYSSLYGVSSLIGSLSKKIVDVSVKSTYCKECEAWSKKIGSEEYDEWKIKHDSVCSSNHEGSAGGMEVHAIKEMFHRSVSKYGVKYVNYIGDGDSKTYKAVVESKPYGDTVEIKKIECVGHVQKRMGSRLRKCKKDNKGIGGKNKLTAKMIDKLSVYYGLAIRRNFDTVEGMHNAIWATFHHYSSTKEKPEHQFCPEGADSWCEWQRAKAADHLANFKQSYKPLPDNVLKAIKPIYTDLSQTSLLTRCLGGYTQNTNESFNNLIWRSAPKNTNSSSRIVEIATYIAVCLFNDGVSSLLSILNTMGIIIGRNAVRYANSSDSRRCHQAAIRAEHATREARVKRRLSKSGKKDIQDEEEELAYGPGIDDYM